jgi:hypothetical protein
VYSAFKIRETDGSPEPAVGVAIYQKQLVNLGFILVLFINISSGFHRFREISAFESRKTHSEGKSAAGGAT